MLERDINGTATAEVPQELPFLHHDAPERLSHDGLHNKLLEQVLRTPGRRPSPRPTHLGFPGFSPNRLRQEESSGYEAPKFEGKDLQMDQGQSHLHVVRDSLTP